MNKAAIICKLHEITDHYLLGAGTWPADREFLPAFFRTVRELGLDEDVPESPRTTRSTALGMVACQYLVRKPNPWDFSMSAVATGRAVGDASGRRA